MEIDFVNVTYKENINTPLEETYLNTINLKIEENKIYSIIGDSNSGKEKIPLLINAVAKPYLGSIKIGEFYNNGSYIKNVNKLRMNIGYAPKDISKYLINKTVKDELGFGIKYFKYKLHKKNLRINEALNLVGLDNNYLNKRIDSLTLNEKKKVTLASILIYNPSVIIMEEPGEFLNNKEIEKLTKLIKKLKDKYNKTIIILTKDTNMPYIVSDKVVLIKDGKIIKEGSKDILTDEKLINSANLEVPEIVKFINESNKLGANLTYTSNILDLIKEVYRNVK